MKRSELNRIVHEALNYFSTMGFYLPSWASWAPMEWKRNKERTNEIIASMLGWDITDYGGNEFSKIGLVMFTIRNGRAKNGEISKPYAEKVLLQQQGQRTPYHFHFRKMEDIINRGGGDLVIEFSRSTSNGGLSDDDLTIEVDAIPKTIKARGSVTLKLGESVCIYPGLYHTFYADKGPVLIGEVSSVNDDISDNRFFTKVARFPEVEEDEMPRYLMSFDYQKYL